MTRRRRSIVLVTPALADANNGNWQTAQRWSRLLAPTWPVRLCARWDGGDEDLMIALHARRSAGSALAWRTAFPSRALVLVLTGTDLYRDIDHNADAQQALAAADALVVLNEDGAARLPVALRPRCHVVLQSCAARQPLAKPVRHLRALMVGHLRDEKDPLTYLRAAERLAGRRDILLDHIGAALDPALGAAAAALAARRPGYRWLGALPHAQVRRRIQAAHVLVHTSRMEGGAHVLTEAMRSGTPVIASHIDGNLGLLGHGYPATFAVGDDHALAALLTRARDDAAMLPALARWCAERAPLFSPAAECATLHRLLAPLLADATPPSEPETPRP